MDSNTPYSINDWVVHKHYGVGQIRRIETRSIQGEDVECFKVNTKDSTYWFPATDKENPRIRPVASEDIIKKVVRNLKRKSTKLDSDRKYWKKRIDEVQSSGEILSISNLIRDLSAQQVLRQLNQTEEDALERNKERLLGEWASIIQEDVESLRRKLQKYIQESQAKIQVD